MTPPTPHWTAETEELLHRTLHDLDVRINNLIGDHHCNLVTQVALTALADAGLLVAPGGETRQEWRVRYRDNGNREVDYSLKFTREDADRSLRLARGAWPAAHLQVRLATSYPDGAVTTGPWREVTDDPA